MMLKSQMKKATDRQVGTGYVMVLPQGSGSDAPAGGPGLFAEEDKSPLEGKRSGMMKGVAKVTPKSLPPTVNFTPVVKQSLMFALTGSVAVENITVAMIAGACGGIATSSTVLQPWASCFRIRKITGWNGGTSAGSALTPCEVDWASGISSIDKDEVQGTAIPSGTTQTGAMVFVPPPKSLAGYWINSSVTSSLTVLTMTGQLGTVFVVDIEIVLANNFVPFSSVTIAGGVTGSVYWLALDRSGSNLIRVVGRNFV